MPESFLSNTSIITREVCPWHLSGLDRVFFNCFPDLSYLNFNCIVFWVWRRPACAPCSSYHIVSQGRHMTSECECRVIRGLGRTEVIFASVLVLWLCPTVVQGWREQWIGEKCVALHRECRATENLVYQSCCHKKLLRWWRLFHQPRVSPNAFPLVLQQQLEFPGLCCQ